MSDNISKPMRHAILGAGGVGGLIGACLAHAGASVTLVVRPENVNGRNLRGNGNIDREVSERTVKPKLFGMLSKRFLPDDHCDGVSGMRQTSAHQAAHPASSKNRMPHRFGDFVGHETWIRGRQFCFTVAGRHSVISASLSVWSLVLAR